jgi:ligand-binding SRPBCC domain-containing protein
MAQFETVIEIQAPLERCFDAARDVDLHVRTAEGTGERIVDGRTSGLLELGDSVTFEARHFGLRFHLESKIVEFSHPLRFVDEMQKGPFKRLRHEHLFEQVESGTRMTDRFDFASPLGPLGALADALFVKAHLKRFVELRNRRLKEILESP